MYIDDRMGNGNDPSGAGTTNTSGHGFCRSWWPTVLFMALPTIALALIYLTSYRWSGFLLGVVGVIGYLAFAALCRPMQLPATVASLAFAVGPVMATVYVYLKSPHLYELAHKGGDVLIQMSFFFSGCLILLIAGLSPLFQSNFGRMERVDVAVVVILFAVLFVWALFYGDLAVVPEPGPLLFAGVNAPALSPLLYFRLVFFLFSIYLVTRPRE